MADLLINSQVQSLFAELGAFNGEKYVPSDKCYSVLLHIHEKLVTEDTTFRHFRLIIGFSQLVQKDLIPILTSVNNDKILGLLVKVLANILTPVECLVPIHQLVRETSGYSTVLKLSKLLTTSKTACVNYKVIKRITQVLKENTLKLSGSQGCFNHFTVISDCLCLIKNILHVPNDQYQNHALLWMLFSEKIDEIIIELIADVNRGQWTASIIEIIALFFKNQHVDHMEKLLITMDQTAKSDSSEDNESNTSQHLDNDTSSSQQNTSECSNSDDNDNEQQLIENSTPNALKKRISTTDLMKQHEKHSFAASHQNSNVQFTNDKLKTKSVFKQPASLNGLGSLRREKNEPKNSSTEQRRKSSELQKHALDNKIHNTTTINPIGNKKGKLRMKKKTKKNLKTKLNLQVLPKHMPTQENISYLLRKFTINFLRNGFNTLVNEVYNLLSSNSDQCIDTSLFFWILTYFCRFCKLIRIDLKSVRRIVSFKLVSFIVHKGLKISEQLTISKLQKSHDLNLHVRHLHLVIMSTKEIIKVIEFYRQSAANSPAYMEFIKELENLGDNSTESIAWTNDLKLLFSLLIRNYDSKIQAIGYLHDLIVTNHLILTLFDSVKSSWKLNDNISEHVKKFAAPDIMFNYGIVLHNYKENDDLVNEAVFTMMHHIIGVVENTTVLFQPIILKTFLNIFDKKDDQYNRWSDLIEYVINKFINSPQTKSCPEDSNIS